MDWACRVQQRSGVAEAVASCGKSHNQCANARRRRGGLGSVATNNGETSVQSVRRSLELPDVQTNFPGNHRWYDQWCYGGTTNGGTTNECNDGSYVPSSSVRPQSNEINLTFLDENCVHGHTCPVSTVGILALSAPGRVFHRSGDFLCQGCLSYSMRTCCRTRDLEG